MTVSPRRLAVAVLLGLLALALLPAGAMATGTGAIEGTVSAGGKPVEGALVCVQHPSGGGVGGGCRNADSAGKYTVGGLESGEYIVEFTGNVCPLGGGECTQSYLTQWYNNEQSRATANHVTVGAGTVSGIDASLVEGGAIEGTVSAGGKPVEGALVCVIREGSFEEFGECARTSPAGKYKVGGLETGSYKVEFSGTVCSPPPAGCAHRYITQWYNGKKSFMEADPVTVTAPTTATGINANLVEGGAIAGKVTGNWIDAPAIAGALVCVTRVGGGFGGCTVTSSTGEYKVEGLESGEYTVEFSGEVCPLSEEECTRSYLTQWYNGKKARAEADHVTVSAPATTTGIDASLAEASPKAPVNTQAPVLTGQAVVGAALSCSAGAWANNPASLAYRWLRDGGAIAGQTSSGYTAQSADQGHAISCEVTASNGAGVAAKTSNALQIPLPTAPPTEVGGPTVNTGNGQITLTFDFPEGGEALATARVNQGASLARAVALQAKARKRCKAGFVKKGKRCVDNAPVLYGSAQLNVAAAGTYRLTIAPSGRALAALRRGRALTVTIAFVFTPAGTTDHIASLIAVKVHLKKGGHRHKGKKR